MQIKIKNLVAGQEVAIQGCSNVERVVERLGKNTYRITWKTETVVVTRRNLGVKVHGKWMFGAHDAT